MKRSNLLLNREYVVNGNWYTPKNFLYENFKSVTRVELINTMSSAGDWSGIFVQKIGNVYYLIPFTQEAVDVFSCVPQYIVRTSQFVAKYNKEPNIDDLYKDFDNYIQA